MSVRMMMQGRRPAAGDPIAVATPVAAVWADDLIDSYAHTDPVPSAPWHGSHQSGTFASIAKRDDPFFYHDGSAMNGNAALYMHNSPLVGSLTATLSQPYAIVAVAQPLDLKGDRGIIGGTTATDHFLGQTGILPRLGFGSTLTLPAITSQPTLYSAVVDGSNSALGIQQAGGVSATVGGDAGPGSLQRFTVGAGSSGLTTVSNFWDGLVSFVGVYDLAVVPDLGPIIDVLKNIYGIG